MVLRILTISIPIDTLFVVVVKYLLDFTPLAVSLGVNEALVISFTHRPIPAPKTQYHKNWGSQEKRKDKMSMDLSATIASIADTEKSLAKRLDALKEANPAVFAELDKISNAQKEVEKLKAGLKSYLDEEKDYDVHEVGNVRVSVSRITKIAVGSIEEVPADFKETKIMEVANEKKAEDYLRLYGSLPKGFIDKSYSRFNWTVKKGL